MIRFDNPIVVMSGDEMAQVMWEMIDERLIRPHVEGPFLKFDLSMENRDKTKDDVTRLAAEATLANQVGIKCATITPDAARVKEFNLSKMWKSPNGTIRNFLNGTIFREAITTSAILPLIPGLAGGKPIIIARHGFGDQYAASELRIEQPALVEFVVTPKAGGEPKRQVIREFTEAGVVAGMFNIDSSVEGFYETVFRYALERKLPVFATTKNTILKIYDGMFQDTFFKVAAKFEKEFQAAGLKAEHRLIDDLAAGAPQGNGGFIWACKNYDGDVQSDAIATYYGSLGMMTSVLRTADGKVVATEAAHGTVTRHFRAHQKGESTSTNPIASIFAWSGGLRARALFDGNQPLAQLADAIEKACLKTIEGGKITKDLLKQFNRAKFGEPKVQTTADFIGQIADALKA